VLFDGSSLDNWTPIGNANWRIADGSVQADSGDKRQVIPGLERIRTPISR